MPATHKELSRRTFILKTIAASGVSLYALKTALGVPGLLTPRVAVAADLTTLDTAAAKQMLAMTRQLFPHERLGDEYYRTVVESIDKEMAGSAELSAQIRDGLGELSKAAGGDFAAANADTQLAAMKQLESTPFFTAMVGKTQYYLYNNPAVWPKFGFEGSSWEKGGYINRGFNDVTWTER